MNRLEEIRDRLCDIYRQEYVNNKDVYGLFAAMYELLEYLILKEGDEN